LFSMEVGYIGNYIVMKNGEVLSMSGNWWSLRIWRNLQDAYRQWC
jgi:hypothetical protein